MSFWNVVWFELLHHACPQEALSVFGNAARNSYIWIYIFVGTLLVCDVWVRAREVWQEHAPSSL